MGTKYLGAKFEVTDDLDVNGTTQLDGTLTVGVDDTGHDVKFFGATSGRYLQWDESDDSLKFRDNVKAKFGNGNDLALHHSGSQSEIKNLTGNLIIENTADDADIIFKTDDGSGGTTDYLRLDGGDSRAAFSVNARWDDDKQVQVGSSSDGAFYHNGTVTRITNVTGDLEIINYADDKDIIFQSDDGSGGVEEYFRLDGSANTDGNPRTKFPDNSRLMFGAGDDMDIFHNGTNSFIRNTSTSGDLIIQQSGADKDILLKCDDGSGGETTYIQLDGSATTTVFYKDARFNDSIDLNFGNANDLILRHDGSNSYILNSTGDLYIKNNADDKDIIFQGDDGGSNTITALTLDISDAGTAIFNHDIKLADNGRIKLGDAGNDLEISHSGTNSFIENNTGSLIFIQHVDDGDMIFQADDGSGGDTEYFRLDGGDADGTLTYTKWADNSIVTLGASKDLRIYHNGTNSIIQNYTGNLSIRNGADDGDIIFDCDDGSGGLTEYFRLDGGLSATYIARRFIFSDSTQLQFGNQSDTQIYNDGSNFYIDNITGDQDIIFKGTDSSSDITALTLDMSDAGTAIFNHDIKLADNGKAFFGGGTDLSIYHDGSNSYILHNGDTGNLVIQNSLDDTDIIFKCDDGSGGTTAYITIDGSATQTKFDKNARFSDSVRAEFGSSGDFVITHDGTDSKIENATGDFKIRNFSNDKDIIFDNDNGAGGSTTYFKLDGSLATHDGSATTALHTVWPDLSRVSLGSSADLQIYHDGTNSYIHNDTGTLRIEADQDDGDIEFRADDNSGGLETYMYLDGGNNNIKFQKDTNWIDNEVAIFGTGSDLKIHHDGSNSYVRNFTGDLYIRNTVDDKDIILESDDGSGGTTAYITLDGSNAFTQIHKDFYFLDSVKSYFGSDGDSYIRHTGSNFDIINSTGNINITNNTDDGDIIFSSDDGSGNTTAYLTLDGSAGYTVADKAIRFNDSVTARFGTGSDFTIQHDGTDTYLNNNTGNLVLTNLTDDGDIVFKSDDGSGGVGVYFRLDGSVGGGSTVHTVFPDNSKAVFGTGLDTQIWHDGTNSYIKQQGGGNLIIQQTAADQDIILQSDDGSGGETAYITLDGSAGYTTVQKNIRFEDLVRAEFGDSGDLDIYHTGSYSVIDNATGHLYIESGADDHDIYLRCDDGSGGKTAYFFLDGSRADGTFVYTEFPDNSIIGLGNDTDAQMYHNGTNSIIDNYTGDFVIQQKADDKDVIFKCDDGSGGVETYFYLDGSNNFSQSLKHIRFADNASVLVGSSSDLSITHDGTNSVIANNTGNLQINQNVNDGDLILQCDDGSGGTTAYITLDGSAGYTTVQKQIRLEDSVEFRLGTGGDAYAVHNGSNFFLVNDTGDLTIKNSANDKDIIFQCDDGSGGTENYFYLDGSLSSGNPFTIFPDSSILGLGSGADVQFYHDGSNMTMINTTGSMAFYQSVDDGDMVFYCDDGSGGLTAYLTLDGSEGHITVQKEMQFLDSVFARFGTGSDFKIYHNGSTTFLENNTGDMQITNFADDKDIIFKTDDGSGGTTAYLTIDGSLEKVIVNKPSQRTFGKSSTTDGDANGDIVYFGGTTSMEVGKIYYLNSSGNWALTDADAEATAKGMLAVALGSASDTDGMLIRGMVTLDHDPGTVGDVLFLSTTAGQASSTAPSGNGDIVRVVGYCLDSSNGQVYFNPDGTFVEVTA